MPTPTNMSERVAEARYQRLLELTSSVELATTIADLEQKKPFDDNLHLSPSDAPAGQQQSVAWQQHHTTCRRHSVSSAAY